MAMVKKTAAAWAVAAEALALEAATWTATA